MPDALRPVREHRPRQHLAARRPDRAASSATTSSPSPGSARTWAWRSSSTSSAASAALRPSAVVLVVTVRAIKHHGGREDEPTGRRGGLAAIEAGAANVRRHLEIVARVRPAVRRRASTAAPATRDEELELRPRARARGAARSRPRSTTASARRRRRGRARRGGRRGLRAAERLQLALRRQRRRSRRRSSVATRVYGAARRRTLHPAAERRDRASSKPTASASCRSAWRRRTCRCRPTRRCSNAPEEFTLPVRDIRAYTGAGWLVPLCGDILQMPGLGRTPAALDIDIDAEGRTVGLF